MRRSLLIAASLLLCAGAASAQSFNITIPYRVGLNPAERPPIATYEWASRGWIYNPVEVRWMFLDIDPFGDIWSMAIQYIRNTPDAPEWSPWQPYDPPGAGTSWTTPPMDYGLYVFALQGRDSAGVADTVFDESYNLRRIAVWNISTGPLVMVTNEDILPWPIGSSTTTGDPFPVEWFNGMPASFCWTANANAKGLPVICHRYGWDLVDPDDPNDPGWEIPCTPWTNPEECSPDKVFQSGVHTFYAEAVDYDGFTGRVGIEITYVPEPPPPPQPKIGIFTDIAGTDCSAYDTEMAVLSFYVVHVRNLGAEAVWFSAPQPACFSTAIHTGDSPVFLTTTGDSQTGVEVLYGRCRSSDVHVLTINYFVQGLTGSCCYYPVGPHPDHGDILVKSCGPELIVATGGEAIINPTPQCVCYTPVQETTWGRIKAMYRQ
jgi:hypothetical protein